MAQRRSHDKGERKANRRGAARLAAVQALYQMDIAGTGLQRDPGRSSKVIGSAARSRASSICRRKRAFFRDLVGGVVREQRKLDPLIDEALQRAGRSSASRRYCARCCARVPFELDRSRDVPARVIVSEYVDVADAFVDREETGMVNAVLDQIARKLRAEEFERAAGREFGNDEQLNPAEDRLIARYFGPLAQHPGALGLVDDAAILAPPAGYDLVLKADAIVGSVHFFRGRSADSASRRKALRVNLSDLAAKGAKPLGFLLSLALPDGIGDDWLAAFRERASGRHRTVRVPAVRRRYRSHARAGHGFDRQRSGRFHTARMVRRGGARVGDRVVVTGTIGDAALGLRLRKDRRGLDALEPRSYDARPSA